MTLFLLFMGFASNAVLLVGLCAVFGLAHAQLWSWLQERVSRKAATAITVVVAILAVAILFALVETMTAELIAAGAVKP